MSDEVPGEVCEAADPEWMTEEDGAEAYQEMWASENAGPTPDGYLHRPVWP